MDFCPFLRSSILSRPGKKRWKLPLWLNLLTLLNGMLGNFVFLFGALYLGSLYGAASLTRYLYLPYLAGMILSMFLGKRVLRLFTLDAIPILLSGLTLSLVILLVPHGFIFGLFLLEFLAVTD